MSVILSEPAEPALDRGGGRRRLAYNHPLLCFYHPPLRILGCLFFLEVLQAGTALHTTQMVMNRMAPPSGNNLIRTAPVLLAPLHRATRCHRTDLSVRAHGESDAAGFDPYACRSSHPLFVESSTTLHRTIPGALLPYSSGLGHRLT